MTRRYGYFVLLMALVAGGLRFWSDVDKATLFDRYPHAGGEGALWFRPVGQSLNFLLNMPVAILGQRLLPSVLPSGHLGHPSVETWGAEAVVSCVQAGLTALFWVSVGLALRMLRKSPQHHRGLFLMFALAALAFISGAVFIFREGLFGLEKPPFTVAEWVQYAKATRLSDSALIDPILTIALALWCVAAALLLARFAVRQAKGKPVTVPH